MQMRIDVRDKISGPVFDGQAEATAGRVLEATVKELASRGQRNIKTAALGMNKSGRGGTGRAAAGVLLFDHGLTQVIYGEMVEGQVWWPWLEGVSNRNRDTGFKGYHTFRSERFRIAATAERVAEDELAKWLPAMGGG